MFWRRVARLLWRSIMRNARVRVWKSNDRWYGAAGEDPVYLGEAPDEEVEELDGITPKEATRLLRELSEEYPPNPERVRIHTPLLPNEAEPNTHDPELLLTLTTGAHSKHWKLAAPLLYGRITLLGAPPHGLIIQEQGKGWREPLTNQNPQPPTITRHRDRIIVRGTRGHPLTHKLAQLIKDLTNQTPHTTHL